jgi:hypothetical protein
MVEGNKECLVRKLCTLGHLDLQEDFRGTEVAEKIM